MRLAIDDGVARITIDRPGVRNALDRPAWAALAAAVAGARGSAARVVVVTGANGSFCAGGDLSSIETRLALPASERQAQLLQDAEAISSLLDMGKPTLALVDGAAMGAGLALALACDVRIASARSRFSAAFRKVGLAGDFGISGLLPRQVGRGRALDLMYWGDTLTAEEARRDGLVERVLPDGEFADASSLLVRQLADGPASLSLIRDAIDASSPLALSDSLQVEASAQAEASRSEDAREGARAFLEKRAPRFSGR